MFLTLARDIIDVGETRAMACDGPVGHCREMLSNDEFDQMWAFVEKARTAVSPKPRKLGSRIASRLGISRSIEMHQAKKKGRT